MNRDTAINIASNGIRGELLRIITNGVPYKTRDHDSFMALLTDIKQLFEAEDYIKENLK